jgi:hypothetical protein
MNAARNLAFVIFALTANSIASAQAWMYDDHSYHEGDLHHHSTYEGSVRDAMSRQERAAGAAERDRAEGYQRFMSAEQQRLEIWYQAYEIRRQIEEDRWVDAARKKERRQQRAVERSAAEQAAVRALITQLQMGVNAWPPALRRPEFQASVRVMENVLRDWDMADYVDGYARNALVTEAGVLRRRIAEHAAIRFADRLAAVRTLKLLQRLAALDPAVAQGDDLVASLR